MEKQIELELRAEIPTDRIDEIVKSASAIGKLVSVTKRLSVMFLGKLKTGNVDIRIRINSNGKSELVIKKGEFHSHDRIEISEQISKNQIVGLARIFSLLDFDSKITERENFDFDLGDEINFTLVKSKDISYVEIDKICTPSETKMTSEKLSLKLKQLNILEVLSKEGFDNLCSRLSEKNDWKFNSTPSDFEKLEKLLLNYL